jgi:hypothetical protein
MIIRNNSVITNRNVQLPGFSTFFTQKFCGFCFTKLDRNAVHLGVLYRHRSLQIIGAKLFFQWHLSPE